MCLCILGGEAGQGRGRSSSIIPMGWGNRVDDTAHVVVTLQGIAVRQQSMFTVYVYNHPTIYFYNLCLPAIHFYNLCLQPSKNNFLQSMSTTIQQSIFTIYVYNHPKIFFYNLYLQPSNNPFFTIYVYNHPTIHFYNLYLQPFIFTICLQEAPGGCCDQCV